MEKLPRTITPIDIHGWMLETELQEIAKLSKTVPKNGVIVEVGSLCGRSSLCWAMNADPSVTIYCYDIFYEKIDIYGDGVYYDSWKIFNENLSNFKNVIPIKGHCPNETKYFDDRKIDIFFIDALHKNPEDWEIINHFLPYVKTNGIISGHDYYEKLNSPFPNVNDNIEKLENLYNTKVDIKETLWYLTKN
jgi:hypothetical protein